MAFHLPALAALNASRTITQAKTLNKGASAIELNQLKRAPAQKMTGTLQREGATTSPALPLAQKGARALQRGGNSLRESLTRLRDRALHRGAQNTGAPRPQPRPASPEQASRSPSRPSAPQTPPRPGGNSPASATGTPARTSRLETAVNAADLALQLHSHLQNRPSTPASAEHAPSQTPPLRENAQGKQPERSEEERGKQPVRPTLTRMPPLSETTRVASSEPPEPPAGFAGSEKARGKQPQRGLPPIPEETFSELKESELNPLQQRAHRAAEQDSAERKTVLRPQVAELALDEKGKLSISGSVSENLRNILTETVARPKHTWQAHHASDDNSQHLLMDPAGRVFSLQGSKTSFIGLTQSVAMQDWRQDEPSRLNRALDRHGILNLSSRSNVQMQIQPSGVATISTPGDNAHHHTLRLPDSTIHSQLTGIFNHEREDGEKDAAVKELVPEQLREHGGRLYRLDEAAMHWEQVDKNEEKSFSKLTKQANGNLFAIYDKKTLHDLSSGEKSSRFSNKITGYCTGDKGQTLVLLQDDKTSKQSVKFLNTLTAKKDLQPDISLKTTAADGSARDFHATAVAFHGDELFAVGSNGKLYTGKAPDEDNSEIMLAENHARTADIARHLGNKFTLEGFLDHGSGSLIALVKDPADQRHACTLDGNGVFKPEWNLNASLVMDHHEGLVQPRPLPQDIVDLGRLGKVMIHDDKLYVHDKNSDRWEATFESAASIKRGQDGQAYVINDGLPSRVKVSLKSDKISGVNNQFVMKQMKSSLALDMPLPGFNRDNKARAIAPVDAENLAAISTNNELQIHRLQADSRQPKKLMQTLTKAGIANHLPHITGNLASTLPANGDGNELVDMSTDQKQNLYVLDKQGKLWSMVKDDWQAAPGSRPDARWREVAMPEEMGELASLHNVAGGALMVADTAGRSATLQLAGTRLGAKVVENNPPQNNDPGRAAGNAGVTNNNAQQVADEDRWLVQPDFDPNVKMEAKSHRRRVEKAIERLDEASKSVNIDGKTLKTELNIMGMTGRDSNHVNSRLVDRLSAHLLRPDLSTPRPLKTAWNAMQHNWQGREGLRPIYQHQATLHQQMRAAIANPPAAPRANFADRLAAFDGSLFDHNFIDSLKDFSDTVSDSAHHHATLLGQHTRALNSSGAANETYTSSSLTAMTQKMNPWSDDRNLVSDLAALHDSFPMRDGKSSRALMSDLQQQSLVLHHQKAQPAMKRQRDPHDDMALCKSRLILDGLTMASLHGLMDEMEQLAQNPPISHSDSQRIKEQFRALRDDSWGEDPIRKVTSQGFTNNTQLEACYDAVKTMAKAFGDAGNGLNMTTRTVLKADSQAQMTERLIRTLTSLESGENMGFGRNYGGMLTLAVIPGAEVIGVPGVRGNLDRAYNASFTRADSGLIVTFSRNGGGTGTAFGAVGWNPLSPVPDIGRVKHEFSNGLSIAPSARLGGMVAVAMQRQLQNSVSFTISEAELKPFVEKLTSGQLDPLELLDKGVNHRVKNGTTLSFNVDAAAMAIGGGGLSIPTSAEDPKKNSATLRANIIAQVSSNLASAQSEHSISHGALGTSSSDSNNSLQMMNSLSASAGIAGGVGVATSASKNLRFPMFGVNSTNIQASIDSRTKQSMSIDIGSVDPVNAHQLDKLLEQLGAFNNPKINALVQEIKDADKGPEQDEKLRTDGKKVRTDKASRLSEGVKDLVEGALLDRADNDGTMRPLSKKERAEVDRLKKIDAEAAANRRNQPESSTAARNRAITASNARHTPESHEPRLHTQGKYERNALERKLDHLLPEVLALTPENNSQYGALNAARQLDLQRRAAALHCQALKSAEYQFTYNNLRRVSENNLMHVVHNLFASELPETNADAISRFMENKPMLKEVIRELQKSRNTQAVVTLEMKDDSKLELQNLWLDANASPEAIQQKLMNRDNLRVKSISFSETDTKQEGINVPLFITGGSSSASVSISRNLGKINFSYGEDQLRPSSFSLEGEVAYASQNVVNALTRAETQDKRGVL